MKLLKHKEILAVICKNIMEEYDFYSIEEVMDFIEADSIDSPETSRSHTNTIIHGDSTEFAELHEKVSNFDVLFYPHKTNFKDTIGKYIDFGKSLKLEQEVQNMGGLGQSILEEGLEKGLERGLEKGTKQGDAARLIKSVDHIMKRRFDKGCIYLKTTRKESVRFCIPT